MSDELTAKTFPFVAEGPLCPLLDDGQFLVDVYTKSGNRPSIKAFCKKIKWPGKPKVGFSVGEEQLKSLLPSLFNSPEAREKLDKASQKSGKIAAAPLHQAIWMWLQEEDPELQDAFKDHCHERGEGFFFLTPEELGTLCKELKEKNPADDKVNLAARIVLAFAMLQPADGLKLAKTFVEHFANCAKAMGLE